MVETKTAVIVSLDTAMLGALAVAFTALDPMERSGDAIALAIVASNPADYFGHLWRLCCVASNGRSADVVYFLWQDKELIG